MSDIDIHFSDDGVEIDIGSSDSSDNETLKISRSTARKQKKKGKSILKQRRSNSEKQKITRLPPQVNVPHDTTFESFSNPMKRRTLQKNDIENNSEEEEEEEEERQAEEDFEEEPYAENVNGYEMDNELTPSDGYNTIEDEKQDLIYKFYRLESRGMKGLRKFNVNSDLLEMRAEYKRIMRDAEVKSSLKFSKRMLMAVVSGTEFLNKKFDPLGVELNGWSESVMENMNEGDYDNVFEKLHDKYTGRMNTPPELELMLSLAGSAIMFHMTNTMFKQLPNMNDISKQNPEMMQNIMKSMSSMMNNDQDQRSNEQQRQQGPPPPQSGRREMQGPSMNFGNMFGQPPPPPVVSEHTIPQSSYEEAVPESVLSDSGGSSSSGTAVRNVSFTTAGGSRRRGRKPSNIKANDENIIQI